MPVDELLLHAVVAEHLRDAGRRRQLRAARVAPSYDPVAAVPRPRDAWDAALSAYARAAAAT